MERHYRIIVAAFQLVRAHGGELFICNAGVKYRNKPRKSGVYICVFSCRRGDDNHVRSAFLEASGTQRFRNYRTFTRRDDLPLRTR